MEEEVASKEGRPLRVFSGGEVGSLELHFSAKDQVLEQVGCANLVAERSKGDHDGAKVERQRMPPTLAMKSSQAESPHVTPSIQVLMADGGLLELSEEAARVPSGKELVIKTEEMERPRDVEFDCVAEEEGDIEILPNGFVSFTEVVKKKKKKSKSKKKKELPEQTDPPSIPVVELFPSGEFPEGEIQQYKDE
ncbi:Methionine aminopeptidase 2B [Vitis vinifera]|uniref:Methionine aminopeptidase 2B n=1 Tax=Vitis vinifera TaxID=29760 RepID=A0A438DAZ3_VITVI|nr:Methionine aminopeptidase 2B [Vitis vinifera]